MRRECLDHVVILRERQLRRILKKYVENYFNSARRHQGLPKQLAYKDMAKTGWLNDMLPCYG